MNDILKSISAVVISTFLISLFTYLLIINKIGQNIYLPLMALSILIGLIIYFKDSIKELNLTEMKVILEKNQNIKEEIQKITLNLVRLLSKLSIYSSGSCVNRKELNDNIDSVLTNISINKNQKDEIMKLPRLMEKFMKDKSSLTKEEKDSISEVFSLKEK